MKKWTKGPWAISPTGPRYSINQDCGLGCACSKHIAMVSCFESQEGDREENEANAKLIQAAPILYEVLEQLVESLPQNRDWLNPSIESHAKSILKWTKESLR